MIYHTLDQYAEFYGAWISHEYRMDINAEYVSHDVAFHRAIRRIFNIIKKVYTELLDRAFECCSLMEGISIGIERLELQRIKESTIERDAMHYRWLRDSPYRYKFHTGSNKLFVFDPTSRLYAVKNVKGSDLDARIKQEILDDMINHVGYEQEIEGDSRFDDPEWRFSDERYAELESLAKKKLGFD